MSAIPQPGSSRIVSERILNPLRQVARRQWTVLAAKGVIQTLLASLALLLAVVLVLGLFSQAPVAVRIAVSVLTWGSVIAAAIYFLRPALARRSLVRTALEVENRLKPTRDTHERISSSVELGRESDPRFAGSPALVKHLIAQAEADADAVDPRKLVPADVVTRLGLLLLPLMLLWVLAVWWLPRERILLPMWNLLVPWKSAPAMLSHVAVSPGDITIAQGESVEIRAKVNADRAADRNRRIEHAALTMFDPAGVATVVEMTHVGPREFRMPLDDLQKTFRYHVSTDEGESPEYTVTVNPRPSVEQLDLRYDYPAYTAMPTRLDNNDENGAIDGLQGTKVTIIVHCSNTLTPDSRIVIADRLTDPKATQTAYPLTKSADGTWQARITLTHSAEYAIKLTNNFGLSNKDDGPRPITVTYDERPTISITGPDSAITVRPDDVVPVSFIATDDFGVAKVEAYVQVDGGPEAQPIVVKLHPGDRRSITDQYPLDVAKALQAAKLPDAQGITYWLKATDNRDPDPQFSESTHQTLKIYRAAEGIKAQLDEKRAHDLMEAIRKAISELAQEKPQAEQFTWIDRNRGLTTDEKQNAETVKDRVVKTGSDLSAVADEHKADAYADIASAAKAVVDTAISSAAENVSRIELDADAPEPRIKDGQAGVKDLVEAKTRLEALLKKAEQQEKNVVTADKLQDLAKDQAQLAQKANQANPNQPQDNSQQQQLNNQTEQAIAQDPTLQTEKAREQANKLAQLLNKLDDIQKKQEQQETQVQKQAQLAEEQQKADAIAQKQAELNKKIEQFKHDDKNALDTAGAHPPDANQQQNIVKELNQNQVQQATNDQKQAAQQLETAANQLQAKANDNNIQPNADQQAALNQDQQQTQQAQQEAQQAQQQGNQANQANQAAQQAAQQAQQAQNAANADQKKNAAQQAAQSAQNAANVAKQIQDQAKQVEKQAQQAAQDAHADVQQAAQAADQAAQAADQAAAKAEQAAQAAQQAAQQGDAQAAAQDAQQAGQDAQQAGQQEQNAAQQLAKADAAETDHAKAESAQQQKDQATQAAAEAHELAQEQAALAGQTQPQVQAQQAAQQGAENPQQAAAEQKQLANETAQADAQAGQLQQEAQQAGNADLAQRADAAKADLKDAQAAQNQAAAAEAANQPDQAAGQQEKAENTLAQAEQALRGEAAADAAKPDSAQADAGQADAAKPDAGQPDAGQADAAKPDAGQPDAGQADAGKPDAGQPDAGQADAGKPDSGQADAGQDAGKPEAGQGQAQAAEPHPGEAGQGQPAADQAATPAQADANAAEHAQEALQAQRQAAQGNAEASQEAANALAQAAQELAQASQPTGEPGQDQGQEPGQADKAMHASPVPGQVADSQIGISAAGDTAPAAPPAVVEALGISASDWAKLNPAEQKELVNAAQQSGPPTYQAMIKNYYIRLAHMQAQSGNRR